jgi:hypothetical protein
MKHYPAEFKANAVALYRSRPGATIKSVAADLGVNTETLLGGLVSSTVNPAAGSHSPVDHLPVIHHRPQRPTPTTTSQVPVSHMVGRTSPSRAWSGLYWCWYVAVAGGAGAGPDREECL